MESAILVARNAIGAEFYFRKTCTALSISLIFENSKNCSYFCTRVVEETQADIFTDTNSLDTARQVADQCGIGMLLC